jgi:hypothetical protein
MGPIRLLAAPIRSIVRFPLFQLAVVVAIILFLQAAADNTTFGQIFHALDELVDATVKLFSELFQVKSFTRSGLTAGLMIAYVYLACLVLLFLMRVAIRVLVDLVGWSNAFGLRNAIARERGLRLTARGYHSRGLGLPTFLRRNGKRNLRGPPMISHHTHR